MFNKKSQKTLKKIGNLVLMKSDVSKSYNFYYWWKNVSKYIVMYLNSFFVLKRKKKIF